VKENGIGGVADDSAPVARSDTLAGARGTPPPHKHHFKLQSANFKLKNEVQNQ
jgi:hypothetical protein